MSRSGDLVITARSSEVVATRPTTLPHRNIPVRRLIIRDGRSSQKTETTRAKKQKHKHPRKRRLPHKHRVSHTQLLLVSGFPSTQAKHVPFPGGLRRQRTGRRRCAARWHVYGDWLLCGLAPPRPRPNSRLTSGRATRWLKFAPLRGKAKGSRERAAEDKRARKGTDSRETPPGESAHARPVRVTDDEGRSTSVTPPLRAAQQPNSG